MPSTRQRITSSYDWPAGGFTISFTPPRDTLRLPVKDSGSLAWKGGRYWVYSGYRWDTLAGGNGTGGAGTVLLPGFGIRIFNGQISTIPDTIRVSGSLVYGADSVLRLAGDINDPGPGKYWGTGLASSVKTFYTLPQTNLSAVQTITSAGIDNTNGSGITFANATATLTGPLSAAKFAEFDEKPTLQRFLDSGAVWRALAGSGGGVGGGPETDPVFIAANSNLAKLNAVYSNPSFVGSLDWSKITNRSMVVRTDTFYDSPPWIYRIQIAQVANLQPALDFKSDITHSHLLEALTNVNALVKAAGDMIKWNASTSKWDAFTPAFMDSTTADLRYRRQNQQIPTSAIATTNTGNPTDVLQKNGTWAPNGGSTIVSVQQNPFGMAIFSSTSNFVQAVQPASQFLMGPLLAGDWELFNAKVGPTRLADTAAVLRSIIPLSTTTLPEGTNKYFTIPRVLAVFTAGTNISITADGVISSTGAAGTPGVLSFNNRVGNVVPAAGDYNFGQISGKPTTRAGYGITDAEAPLTFGFGLTRAVNAVEVDSSLVASLRALRDSAFVLRNLVRPETDPTVPAHVKSITTADKANWNTAFGYGPHTGLYALLSGSYVNPSWITSLPYTKITGAPTVPTNLNQLTNGPGYIITETDPAFTAANSNLVKVNGSYTNPAFLVSIPYSKITSPPTIPTAAGGTGLIQISDGAGGFTSNAALSFDITNKALNSGTSNTITGTQTFTFGEGILNKSYKSAYFGRFAVDASGASTTTWVATDPLLVVGNGASTGARANALTILKNGNTTIGGTLDITGALTASSVIFPGGTQTVPFTPYTAGSNITIVGGVISAAGPGDTPIETDPLAVKLAGSYENPTWITGLTLAKIKDPTTYTAPDSRVIVSQGGILIHSDIIYNTSTRNFGVGASTGFNPGVINSLAIGQFALVNGNSGVAVGTNATSNGFGIAVGASVTAGDKSSALGQYSNAYGKASFSSGWEINNNGWGMVSLGVYSVGMTGVVPTTPENYEPNMNDIVFQFGNGKQLSGPPIRSNAFSMTRRGDMTFSGFVKASKVVFADGSEQTTAAVSGGGGTESDPVFTAATPTIVRTTGSYSNPSWITDITVGKISTPAGNNQVLYTSGGLIASSSEFLFNPTQRNLGIGISNTITGQYAMGVGTGHVLSGNRSLTVGQNSTVSGAGALAVGSQNSVLSNYSLTVGELVTNKSYAALFVGRNPLHYDGASNTTWVSTDPLLVAGNGDLSTPGNALELLKNGNLKIGGSLTIGAGGLTFADGSVQNTANGGGAGADGNNFVTGGNWTAGVLSLARAGLTNVDISLPIPSLISQLSNDVGYVTNAHNHNQADVTGLTAALAAKQNTLTPGTGITIVGNTISSAAALVTSVNGDVGAVVIDKAKVGLGNVQNVDQTNANNLTSGFIPTLRISNASLSVAKFSATGFKGDQTALFGDNTWKVINNQKTVFVGTSTGVSFYTFEIETGGPLGNIPESGVYEISITGNNYSSGGTSVYNQVIQLGYDNPLGSNISATPVTLSVTALNRTGEMASAIVFYSKTGRNITVQATAGDTDVSGGTFTWTAEVVSKVKSQVLF